MRLRPPTLTVVAQPPKKQSSRDGTMMYVLSDAEHCLPSTVPASLWERCPPCVKKTVALGSSAAPKVSGHSATVGDETSPWRCGGSAPWPLQRRSLLAGTAASATRHRMALGWDIVVMLFPVSDSDLAAVDGTTVPTRLRGLPFLAL